MSPAKIMLCIVAAAVAVLLTACDPGFDEALNVYIAEHYPPTTTIARGDPLETCPGGEVSECYGRPLTTQAEPTIQTCDAYDYDEDDNWGTVPGLTYQSFEPCP